MSTPAHIRDLAGIVAAADGVAPLSGHVLEALDAGRLITDVVSREGTPVAVSAFPENDPAELFVVPDSRGRGIGTSVVAAALDRAGAVWAHGDLPAAAAVAARLGLVRTRVLLQMRRTATGDVDPPVLPDGVSIRTYRPGADDASVLAVNSRAFAWHPEQGRLDQAGLDEELAQDWFDADGFFVAVEDATGTVLGFHWTKVHPATVDTPAVGEVYVLGVDPLSGVRGLGAPLTAVGLRHLARRGLDTVLLYVEGDNDRAIALYRRYGFDESGRDVVYRRG